MAFYLRAKKLDFSSGGEPWVAVIQEKEADTFGIILGDLIEITWGGNKVVARAYYTRNKVKPGEIGLFREIWKRHKVQNNEPIALSILSRPPSIKAIQKKLLDKPLSYGEMYSIVHDIVERRLGHIEITYFVASSFLKEYSDQELYYLTKAMAETGETLKFPGKVVADKHSVGGLPGNRTTMVVVPIVASYGILIPKTSSRSVTSPSGTADTMEVLAPVDLPLKKIMQVVKKNKGCMVWGGSFKLAPADDCIIQVSHSLGIEPYTKMLVSIMAKKVATGITHLVIDIPFGPTTKIPDRRKAWHIRDKFIYLSRRFGIKTEVVLTEAREPIGRGIGPSLEARDVLRVLQQKDYRPTDLEQKSLKLAGKLLELCGTARKGEGEVAARESLAAGWAWKKMQGIIKSQGGNPNIDSEDLTMAAKRWRVHTPINGVISFVNNKAIDDIARVLGAPHEKPAGLYINKRIGQKVRKGERMFTLYAQSKDRIKLALEALKKNRIFKIKRV